MRCESQKSEVRSQKSEVVTSLSRVSCTVCSRTRSVLWKAIIDYKWLVYSLPFTVYRLGRSLRFTFFVQYTIRLISSLADTLQTNWWCRMRIFLGWNRSQKSEVRSQKSEVRSQKSEVRSQKSEVRSSNEFESCVVYSVQSYPLCVVKGGLKGVTYSILYTVGCW